MLKIGLIIDTEVVPKVLLDFVRRCQQDQVAFFYQIRITGRQPGPGSHLQALRNMEKMLVKKDLLTTTLSLSSVGQLGIPMLNLTMPTHQATIPEDPLDLLLDFGLERNTDPIACSQSRLGILRLVDSEHRSIFAPEAGFWEVYDQSPVSRFSILHTAPRETVSQVVWTGSATTGVHYLLNHLVLIKKAWMGLYYYLKKVARTSDLIQTSQVQQRLKVNVRPVTWGDQIRYLAKMTVFLAILIGRHIILQKRYRWTVGFIRSGWDQFDPSKCLEIPNQPYHFNADPFVIREKEDDYCLVETLDYRNGKGKIAAFAIHAATVEDLGTVLEEPFHMSYPYPFRYEDKIYLCPETSAKQEIRIYEAIEFPTHWKLAQIAMQQVSAVDSLIFEQAGKWWLLTNIDSSGVGDHASELHIFYADQPITDRWQPHPDNPVLFDASKARNGGIIFAGDTVYRVAQSGGFFRYGTGITIQKIDRLTVDSYHETMVQTIGPADLDRSGALHHPAGNHHLHGSGNRIVFDYCHLQKPDHSTKSGRMDHRP